MSEKLLTPEIGSVLVTGGAGFIGSTVVDMLLSQGYKTTVLDNFSNGRREFVSHHSDDPNFKLVEGDILDESLVKELVQDADLVWHLAANTDIIGGHDQPRRDLRDCVMGTFNVVDAIRVTGPRALLFSSTGAVYGQLCVDISVNEGSGPLLPVSTYAAGKIGSEAFISAFCNLYGIRAWIFRFGNVIGSRMTHGVIYDFVHRLKQDPSRLLIRGDGRQEKNYFLVEECIDGMGYAFKNIAMTDDQPCDIFNLGTSSVTRVVELAQIVKEEMGLPDAELVIEGTKKAWPGDQPRVHIDVDKMTNLGWKAKLSSDQAVRIAVKRLLTEV